MLHQMLSRRKTTSWHTSRTGKRNGFSMGNLLKPAVIEGRTSRGPFKTWEEMTPLNYAIETRDLSVLRYLVDAFSRVGPGGKEFLARSTPVAGISALEALRRLEEEHRTNSDQFEIQAQVASSCVALVSPEARCSNKKFRYRPLSHGNKKSNRVVGAADAAAAAVAVSDAAEDREVLSDVGHGGSKLSTSFTEPLGPILNSENGISATSLDFAPDFFPARSLNLPQFEEVPRKSQAPQVPGAKSKPEGTKKETFTFFKTYSSAKDRPSKKKKPNGRGLAVAGALKKARW